MKTRTKRSPVLFNPRALPVEQLSYVPKGGYDVGNDTVHTLIGVFLVPKDFDQYTDARGLSSDEWLKTLKARFTFIPPASGGQALLFPS